MLSPESEATRALDLEVAVKDDRAAVSVRGEIDVATAEQLDDALATLADQGVSTFTIDMADVSFMDSTGLGCVVRLLVNRRDAKVTFVNMTPSIRNLFEVTGLATRVAIV